MLDPTLDIRKERYAIAVGVTVANLWDKQDKLVKKRLVWEQKNKTGQQPPMTMTDEQRRWALAEHARGVLALMPDFDQLMGDVDDTAKVVAS